MSDDPRSPSPDDVRLQTTPPIAAAAIPPVRPEFYDREFWRRETPALLAFASKQLRSYSFKRAGGLPAGAITADDVVQTAWVALVVGECTYASDISPRTCAFRTIARIVRNLARLKENRTPHDVLTTVPTDTEVEEIDESRIVRTSRQLSPEDLTIGRDEAERLLPLIPPKCRSVVRLKIRRDGISAKEIARELGLFENEVWVLILRARRSFVRHRTPRD